MVQRVLRRSQQPSSHRRAPRQQCSATPIPEPRLVPPVADTPCRPRQSGRNDARCTGCYGICGTRATRCHRQHDSESRQTKPVRRPAHSFDDARSDVTITGLQVWTGRISSLPSTSHSRTTAGTEAPVIGQLIAGGGQQRSWLTSARFLTNRTVIARHTKEIVLSTFVTAIPEGAGP